MNQIDEMQNFVRIVEAGSITKAAEQLNTAKSAVSRKLTELETRLNTSLLTRTTRSQSLTENGRQYYHHCLRILNEIYEIEGQFSNRSQVISGLIKLSVPLSFGLNVLSPLLSEFKKQHPSISLDVDFSDRKADLVEEGFDLAIRVTHLNDDRFIAKKICDVKLLLCASQTYLNQHGIPSHPNDLAENHQRLRYPSSPESWTFIDNKGKSFSTKLPYSISANNGDFLMQAASDGLGLAFVPDFIAKPFLDDAKVISMLEEYTENQTIAAYAVYPYTRYLSHRVRVFIAFLQSKLS
jgi:DNA-binding transcriptional LysR family regulator